MACCIVFVGMTGTGEYCVSAIPEVTSSRKAVVVIRDSLVDPDLWNVHIRTEFGVCHWRSVVLSHCVERISVIVGMHSGLHVECELGWGGRG